MAAKLTYTNGRGLTEVIRIALGAAEIPFDESFIETAEDLAKLKSEGNLLFNQSPLLEIDGLKLVQSMAILRYICRKQGWMGKSPEQKARIEMLSEGARDMYGIILWAYLDKLRKNKDKEWQQTVQKAKDRYLTVFEKELESSGSGYLVGDSLTMCDIVFLDGLTWIAELEMEALTEFPNILNFLATITSLPGIKKFLDGPQRKPIPDIAYTKFVFATFDI